MTDNSTSKMAYDGMLAPVLPDGLQVFVADHACISREWKQIRFPKSKKKRIRKKWSKNDKYYGLADTHKAFQIGNKLYVSSKMFEALKHKATVYGC